MNTVLIHVIAIVNVRPCQRRCPADFVARAEIFRMPLATREGDYIEIGQTGAYGRVSRSRFNGFGRYREVVLEDLPMLSMFGDRQHRQMMVGPAGIEPATSRV